MGLVPCALVAGLCTIRFFPATPHAQAAGNYARSAAKPVVETMRVPAPAALPAETPVAPPVAPPIESQTLPIVAPLAPPPPVMAKAEKPATVVRPAASSRVPGARQAGKPPHSAFIRVTGEEQHPVIEKPAAKPPVRHLAEAPEPVMPPSVDTRNDTTSVVLGTDPQSVAASQAAALEKSQNGGNRLVKALGKVFRKQKKPAPGEAVKTELRPN
jgi:hypothetical protein